MSTERPGKPPGDATPSQWDVVIYVGTVTYVEALAFGYCDACREMEMHLYNDVVSYDLPRHIVACRAAGCLHPPYYVFPDSDDGRRGGRRKS